MGCIAEEHHIGKRIFTGLLGCIRRRAVTDLSRPTRHKIQLNRRLRPVVRHLYTVGPGLLITVALLVDNIAATLKVQVQRVSKIAYL